MSVSQPDIAAAVSGNLGIVRNEDYRPAFGMQFLEEHQYIERCACIQVACRFVREYYGGIVDKGPRYGHPLHLSAGHLVGLVLKTVSKTHGFKSLHCTAAPFPVLSIRICKRL